MEDNKYPIKEEWEEYYQVLEGIRRTGVCNMFAAAPYLKEVCPELSDDLARTILVNWMENYKVLCERYEWRN